MIGYSKLTGDSSHDGCLATTFAAAQRQHAGFINDYYDDNGWWALAWVAAFDMTRDSRYLDAARTIFTRNTAAWDDTCGGGLWWNTARNYKNAITNELFLTLAALLHQRTPGDRQLPELGAAGVGVVQRQRPHRPERPGQRRAHLGVREQRRHHLDLQPGRDPRRARRAVRDHRRSRLPAAGRVIANAALSKLATPASAHPPGILAEPCEPAAAGCNGDQAQFKGIFVRYLYDFWLQSRQPAYRAFILANARSVWDNSKNAADQFGLRWAGPFDRADAARQSSALDVLIAAAALDKGSDSSLPYCHDRN